MKKKLAENPMKMGDEEIGQWPLKQREIFGRYNK